MSEIECRCEPLESFRDGECFFWDKNRILLVNPACSFHGKGRGIIADLTDKRLELVERRLKLYLARIQLLEAEVDRFRRWANFRTGESGP